MKAVLNGIRVVDWTLWHMGPYAGNLLGEFGAEVIKIEDLKGGDPARGVQKVYGAPTTLASGRNAQFENFNQNKKSVAVNLKDAAGREVVYRLVRKSDVFLHNYRSVAAKELGMSYGTLKRYNPAIIYASGSGLGKKGPFAHEPALDSIGLARSGFLLGDLESTADEFPYTMPPGVADHAASIMLVFGIMTALLAKQRYGIGQEIHASHLGTMLALQASILGRFLLTGKAGSRSRRTDALNPLDNYYRCRDRKWLFFQLTQSDRHWPKFCQALRLENLIDDPRFSSMEMRERNHKELIAILDEVFATKTSDEWTLILRAVSNDFIFCKAQNYNDLLSDPQVIANEYIVEYEHPVLGTTRRVSCPVTLSKTPAEFRLPAPEYGQHTEEILTEICGYNWHELEQLKRKGVIL